MDVKTAVDLGGIVVQIPLWSLLAGIFSLLAFGIGLGWHGFSIRQSIRSNIEQNNVNHQIQMKALAEQNHLLEKIICLIKVQLYAIGNPKFKYRGECDDL